MVNKFFNGKHNFSEKVETAAVFTISFIIIGLKNSFHEVIYPILPAEDGKFLFQVFYNDHELKDIFRVYSGYVSLLPNLLAYCLTWLPVKIIPSSFSLISLFITAATYSLFYKLSERIYHDKFFSAYVLIIICMLPLGNLWLIGSLAYQSWNFFLTLLLLYFLPVPQRLAPQFFYILLINLLIWSHPLSLIVVPLYLMKLLKNKTNKYQNTLFCCSGTLYGIFGIVPEDLLKFGISFSDSINLLKVLIVRVVGEALAGPQNRILWYKEGHSNIFISMFILSFLIFVFSVYHSRKQILRIEISKIH